MKLGKSFIIFLFVAGIGFSQQLNTENNSELIGDETIIEVNVFARNSSEPINTYCPVEEKVIDNQLSEVIYSNKIIGFCCESCSELFLKNPRFYLEKLKVRVN